MRKAAAPRLPGACKKSAIAGDDETPGDPTTAIAHALAESGIAVCREFLGPAERTALALECRRALEAGELKPAQVGRRDAQRVRPEIRGDRIRWLDAAGPAPVRALFERMEALRVAINRHTYLGLFDFECHFSVYAPGMFYRRHLDRFADGGPRVVSCVVYLNEAWDDGDGGTLRIHARDDRTLRAVASGATVTAGDGHLDVLPLGGTLVAFSSAEYEHEVLAAKRERMSVAGWFRTREACGLPPAL
jgi:SM-20-related protein